MATKHATVSPTSPGDGDSEAEPQDSVEPIFEDEEQKDREEEAEGDAEAEVKEEVESDREEAEVDREEAEEHREETEGEKEDIEEGGREEEEEDQEDEEEEQETKPTVHSDVASLLARLQSSGALIKQPKREYRCHTCDKDFHNWADLENHLIQHVSLPSVVLDKLPSDDEDVAPSGDENWSDEEEDAAPPPAKKTPQKIDISQILKKTGISLKKPGQTENTNPDSALNKLSGLGFTIKKNITPIKKEPEPEKNSNDVMQKLGKLGGIKLKLKSDGNNTNSFKVINGLKDFNASDEEDEGSGSGNEDKDDEDEEADADKSAEPEGSDVENDSEEENEETANNNRKTSESDESPPKSSAKSRSAKAKTTAKLKQLKNLQGVSVKKEPIKKEPIKKEPVKKEPLSKAQSGPTKVTVKELPPEKRPPGRPAVKQTPKRGQVAVAKGTPQTEITKEPEGPQTREKSKRQQTPPAALPTPPTSSAQSTPDRRESHESSNISIKQEVEAVETQSSNVPIFSSTQIKSERTSPPPTNNVLSTPILARVKSEPDLPPTPAQSTSASNSATSTPTATTPLLPVTKREDTHVDSMTIIEINGDSGDDDDDCCVVSATPAPDVKPVIPKTEPPVTYPTTPSYSSTQPPSFSSNTMLSTRLTAPSTEKTHNFNWNAPDTKPPLDMLEKSTDDIFESLLSSSSKKEPLSISDASEYISLDTLGPQHTCDVCNTRFTDISLLDDHRRMTGHSKTIAIVPAASSLMPYNPSSNLLSSLLPVKQLADQVGKLATIGSSSSSGFSHQQNVMINIQAYPGAGGMMMPPQQGGHPGYNPYPPQQNMPPDYSQAGSNMYCAPGQAMPGQYPGQSFVGSQHGYGQFQQNMPKTYPGAMGQGQFPPSSSPYSVASPLQGMQQAVYGQAPISGMTSQMGQMGPPGGPFAPASSPGGSMKPPTSNIKIQNVQTFPVGQTIGQMLPPGQQHGGGDMAAPQPPGQMLGTQMQSPNQIRMAPGANITGTRPRMATPRGPRPSIRPGIQVQGQVRGQKPGMRMPMKRPAGMQGGPVQKRRPDMLLPGKHDNEDCQVMAMQKQRDGLPMISSVQGAKDKLNFGSQISVTKKTVNKEASAMANVLASRGISIKQKQKSRSPSPERPVTHNIPNLGPGVSIKHTSKSSSFSIPEAKVGGGMLACKICKKMFMNENSLSVHMSSAHPNSKLPSFKCDECPASYPKSLQLQHHKRVFHNVSGPNRELGLPVVDLSQEDNLKRLSSLGIYSFIPLANREQGGGCFGIPVISVHNAQNGMTSSLQALGADGLLSLGPLKPLPNS